MAGKKIKLDTEDISEFLVAVTDSESCSEASDFEAYFEEEEEEKVQQQQQQKQFSATSKRRLRQVVDYQPGVHLNEGTQIFKTRNC